MDELRNLACSFELCRRTIPVSRICLLDSLALIDFLARHRHFPELVVGVTLFPFAAHCWVQSGEWALNEKTDLAASFTPILVM